MAWSEELSEADLVIIKPFLNRNLYKTKGYTLDLCGGISRCGKVLQDYSHTIDVLDIKPSFELMPPGLNGQLIQCNLTEIGQYCESEKYDLIFGNWSLCYISD